MHIATTLTTSFRRGLNVAATAVAILIAPPASAALVQFDFSVTNNISNALLSAGMAQGTVVTGSILADIAPSSTASGAVFNSASGVLSWENGGTQTYEVTSMTSNGSASSGQLTFGLQGSSSAPFGSRELVLAFLLVNVGVNPFTSTEPLLDLLLTQTNVTRLGFGLSGPGSTSFAYIDGAPSSQIVAGVSPVPLPATLPLMALALFIVGLLAHRRKTV